MYFHVFVLHLYIIKCTYCTHIKLRIINIYYLIKKQKRALRNTDTVFAISAVSQVIIFAPLHTIYTYTLNTSRRRPTTCVGNIITITKTLMMLRCIRIPVRSSHVLVNVLLLLIGIPEPSSDRPYD